MKKLFTTLLLLTAFNTFVQTDTLPAKQTKTMINKEVIVKAMVWLPSVSPFSGALMAYVYHAQTP
jgi:hypothetical protein